MTVILVDEATDRDIQVNGWNWGVLHAIVEAAGVFPTEMWAPARSAGCGGKLEATDVRALVHFLETRVLAQLRAGERVDHEFLVTAKPGARLSLGPQRYSLERHVLVAIIEFLRATSGAVSVR